MISDRVLLYITVAAKNEISLTAGNRGTLCPDLIQ